MLDFLVDRECEELGCSHACLRQVDGGPLFCQCQPGFELAPDGIHCLGKSRVNIVYHSDPWNEAPLPYTVNFLDP